jgi:N-acetylglucosamine-6-phosphate deacetylase
MPVAGRSTIEAGAVVTPAGLLAPGRLRVRDGFIEAVEPVRSAPGRSDLVLLPGFVDLQVNGVGTTAVAGSDARGLARIGEQLAALGTTTWCPTLVSGPLAVLEADLRAIAAARTALGHGSSRRILADQRGAHLEGPFITVAGAHPVEHLLPRVDRAWLERVAFALDVVTIAPELDGGLEAVHALSRQVLVALGHSACSFETALKAAAAGARLVTHLGNACGTLHQRAPGLIGAALVERRLVACMIGDLLHLHPGFVVLCLRAKGAGRCCLVSDLVPERGLAGASTDRLAGSTASLAEAVSRLYERGVADLRVLARLASTTPARLLGLGDRGALVPGRRADVVALRHRAGGPSEGMGLELEEVWVLGRRVGLGRRYGP